MTSRPTITDHCEVRSYLRAMIEWRKASDPKFSVRSETRGLRRCSPSLVTRVLQGKRRLVPERVDDFARLLRLSAQEKAYLSQWVQWDETTRGVTPAAGPPPRWSKGKRKEAQNHLLANWLNVYVRETCRLKGFRLDPKVVQRMLGGVATVRQVERSLSFLMREGYLRRTLDGRIVENDPIFTTTDEQFDENIRRFHRRSLEIAKRALSLHSAEERRESAVLLRLNRSSLPALKELLKEFYEKLLLFAEDHLDEDERLYQVTLNLFPIGGRSHDPQTA